MQLKNATNSSNKITQSMGATVNNRVWGNRFYDRSTNSPKFCKQIDAMKFIYDHFHNLLTLQNLNEMEAEDQYVQLVEYAFQYHYVKT